ncbi:MAG: hypothetical protein K2J73_12620 [Oscillospiraceae bacterium]|nr:hypothetical protein [Oscillospiraceae bacterium]
MNNDTDVLEFDFPDYEEPYPPFPDVKVVSVDMDEAYRRNIELAKQFPPYIAEPAEKGNAAFPDIAEPAEKAKPVPRKKKAAKPRGRKIITSAAAYAAVFIGILAAVFFANVQKPEEAGGNLTIRTDYEECAEFEQRLESIALSPYTDEDGQQQYDVTIGFTMKNISDAPVIFFPKLLDAYSDNGSFSSPVSMEGTRDFDGGVFAVINYQKDFTVTYRLNRKEASQISFFGYSMPYRYKIDIDSKVKDEIAAFLADEAP